MKTRTLVVCVGIVTAVMSAAAQTTVTTSGGSNGTVPVFDGTSSVGNSLLTQANNGVGIASSPSMNGERFTVMSDFDSVPTIYWGYDTTTANAPVSFGKSPYLEIVGEGNGNEAASIGLLQLNISAGNVQGGATWEAPSALYLSATNATTASAAGTTPVTNGDILGKVVFAGDDGGSSVGNAGALIDAEVDTANESVSKGVVPAALNLVTMGESPITFYTDYDNTNGGDMGPYFGGATARMRIAYDGDVGIGTTSPTAKLEVDGNIKLTAGSGASITFPDGTVQSTAYTGVACGGDYAESVKVQGKRPLYAPGDVLVISKHSGSDVALSQTPYSTSVVGVFSTKPGYVGRRFTGPKSKQEVPMAMIGIVPVKVTAANGPIHRGDLLVTSSIPGYAMKGTDRGRMLGAVLGKALGNLASGKGVIEVVITLQ